MNKRLEETPQSVIANVHKAAQLLKEKGSEALAVLTDPKSEFNDRDAYLFIIDVDKSLVVSNPRFPERTGGIFAPCHRVVGSDRSLTGFAGGLDAKRTLLKLEGVL